MSNANKIIKAAFLFPGLLASLMIFSCRCPSETEMKIPRNVIEKSNQQIIAKTGDEFFKNNFNLDLTGSKNLNGKYLMKYDFKVESKPFVDEEISFMVDSTGKLIDGQKISGIPNCVNGDCDFSIVESEAKQIAASNKLEKGIKDWKTDFVWNDRFKKYVWKIISTTSESQGSEGYRGSGNEMIIDANNGKVLETNAWHVR